MAEKSYGQEWHGPSRTEPKSFKVEPGLVYIVFFPAERSDTALRDAGSHSSIDAN